MASHINIINELFLLSRGQANEKVKDFGSSAPCVKKWEENIRNPCAVKSQSGRSCRIAPYYSVWNLTASDTRLKMNCALRSGFQVPSSSIFGRESDSAPEVKRKRFLCPGCFHCSSMRIAAWRTSTARQGNVPSVRRMYMHGLSSEAGWPQTAEEPENSFLQYDAEDPKLFCFSS